MEPTLLASCAAPPAGQPSNPCLDEGQSEPGGAAAFTVVVQFAIVAWVVVMRPPARRHRARNQPS